MEKTFKVAGVGELLWDILPSGKQIGGAPFNFAYYTGQAGCEPYVISAIGRDELGVEILEKVKQLGISHRYVQQNHYPTSTVTVELDKNGQPEYTIHEDVAWDYIHWNEEVNELSKELDTVCFGSLAQRNPESASTIKTFLKALSPKCLKIFDINLRQHYFDEKNITESLYLADILKLNSDELHTLSGYYDLHGEIDIQLKALIKKFDLKYVVYTMGSKGSIIASGKDYSYMKAPKVIVCDTVGAGDSFTAILVAGLLHNKSLKEIHQNATKVAAYVCTQKGAITESKYLIQK